MQYVCIDSIMIHQRKITHEIVIPTILEYLDKGSLYLPSRLVLEDPSFN